MDKFINKNNTFNLLLNFLKIEGLLFLLCFLFWNVIDLLGLIMSCEIIE